ncbi:BMT2 [Branchiostoma lanceolatum]|uniref:S-adenosylmethionine sensor upstream of mTORC1 n=1 Tax=Branchiostoma lanceolatum TaxID=7740 RepID=A0A8J9ZWT3_BRALA|nr:BMT2 [Branchiostoma lanceolatum]
MATGKNIRTDGRKVSESSSSELGLSTSSSDGKDDKEEKEKLSGVVKGVHAKLRRKYREVGDFDKIWQEHCEDEQSLSEYACAMRLLAVDHWKKTTPSDHDRIEWCRRTCYEFFRGGGLLKCLEKDDRRRQHTLGGATNGENCETERKRMKTADYNTIRLPFTSKIRLLDVGSCYNPFMEFEDFLAIGIDIVPAVESVFKCDFLNLQVQEPLQLAPDTIDTFLRGSLRSPLERVPREIFHVVVFSLLLSYFPSPYQRWICCQKAHELLALNGLLLIITPDSSHQGRNAAMIKSWRKAIESMGFQRWRYGKDRHLHLMAFRKVSRDTRNNLLTNDATPDMLYIPQDFNEFEEESVFTEDFTRSESEERLLLEGFGALPDGMDELDFS